MIFSRNWEIWSWLWRLPFGLSKHIACLRRRIFSIFPSTGGQGAVQDDEERAPPLNQPSSADHIGNLSNSQLLIIGISAEVYLLGGKTIRKLPRSDEDIQSIIREAMIYDAIGPHVRIAECTSIGSGHGQHVDIKYYPHGDLAAYIRHNSITSELQSKWFQQIIEAIVVIHSLDIIHSDLALRQFFVDDNLNLRLGDFNFAQCPQNPALGYEKASHCLPRDYDLPNTQSSDIFAMGSTLYELVTGRAPYSELNVLESNDPDAIKAHIKRQHEVVDFEIERRYRNHQYPDVTKIPHGDIILGCWRGGFVTAKQALESFANSIRT